MRLSARKGARAPRTGRAHAAGREWGANGGCKCAPQIAWCAHRPAHRPAHSPRRAQPPLCQRRFRPRARRSNALRASRSPRLPGSALARRQICTLRRVACPRRSWRKRHCATARLATNIFLPPPISHFPLPRRLHPIASSLPTARRSPLASRLFAAIMSSASITCLPLRSLLSLARRSDGLLVLPSIQTVKRAPFCTTVASLHKLALAQVPWLVAVPCIYHGFCLQRPFRSCRTPCRRNPTRNILRKPPHPHVTNSTGLSRHLGTQIHKYRTPENARLCGGTHALTVLYTTTLLLGERAHELERNAPGLVRSNSCSTPVSLASRFLLSSSVRCPARLPFPCTPTACSCVAQYTRGGRWVDAPPRSPDAPRPTDS